jgi:hypothetical protein
VVDESSTVGGKLVLASVSVRVSLVSVADCSLSRATVESSDETGVVASKPGFEPASLLSVEAPASTG